MGNFNCELENVEGLFGNILKLVEDNGRDRLMKTLVRDRESL